MSNEPATIEEPETEEVDPVTETEEPEAPEPEAPAETSEAKQARAEACYGIVQQVLKEYRCAIAPYHVTKPVGADGRESLTRSYFGVVPME